MPRDMDVDLVASIRRATERAVRIQQIRADLPRMPWHLRARRAITNWLFAWQRHQDGAVAAELRRQLSELSARGLEKP